MTEESPLKWPPGVPRSTLRKESRYGDWTWSKVVDQLERELRLLGATELLVSSSAGRGAGDPGVAVYFVYRGGRMVLPADRWQTRVDNARAISLFIEALRAQERGGVAQVVDRTLSGFRALPPPPVEEPWWKVLGCDPDVGLDVVEMFYRARAKKAHPDAGGSQAEIIRFNRAIEQARAQLGRRRPPEAST